jgi:hypothetical protein
MSELPNDLPPEWSARKDGTPNQEATDAIWREFCRSCELHGGNAAFSGLVTCLAYLAAQPGLRERVLTAMKSVERAANSTAFHKLTAKGSA